MTVRRKITLLITAAGFLSSLVFSCVILWEMLEQPLRIIDAELEDMARRAVYVASSNDRKNGPDASSYIGDERYWLKVTDAAAGREIYRSRLAGLIRIPEPAPGSGAMESLAVPRAMIDPGRTQRSKVPFRIRNFRIVHDGKIFLVTVGRPVEKLEEELWDTFIGVGSGLAFSVLLLLAISYFFAGFMLKPIRAINAQAREISERHLDRRMPVGGSPDEFNALAQTLNQVFDRLQHAFLRQKRLLADASHELKTPLTMMRLALDGIRSNLGETQPDPQAESHERLTEQVLRMERLVKSLLDLSALEIEAVAARSPIDLVQTLVSLAADYRMMAEPRNIRISIQLPERLNIEGDQEKLNRAFSNILDNAVKYNIDGGQVDIVGEHSETGLSITIRNTGPGVPQMEIPKIFDQFYRVEQSRSLRHGGSGLGLAIVKRIVELHGGEVTFESRQEEWTRVTVALPRHRQEMTL